MPLAIALSRPDGSLERIETSVSAGYDEERGEAVLAFKDAMTADEVFRIIVGSLRRAEKERME